MLNRRYRLLTPDDFRTALRRGRKIPIHGALVAIRRTEVDNPLRCGFVVSKAVGNAVERNTVKRRLRAACSTLIGHYHGADLVVRADRYAQDVSVDTWRLSLASVLDKVVGA